MSKRNNLRAYDLRESMPWRLGVTGEQVAFASSLVGIDGAALPVPFDVQGVADWWMSQRVQIDMGAIGAIRPAFSACWFEWRGGWPDGVLDGDALVALPQGDNDDISMVVKLIDFGFQPLGGAPGEAILVYEVAQVHPKMGAWVIPGTVEDRLDSAGRLVATNVSFSTRLAAALDGAPASVAETFRNQAAEDLQQAASIVRMALAFANIRNADVELEPERTATKSDLKLMGGRKLRRFRRIHIPGTNRGGSTSGGSRDTPAHLVRGHFKTYTPDRPLFGQHVGTYWWSWHARGDEEHGTVDHEYVVHPT